MAIRPITVAVFALGAVLAFGVPAPQRVAGLGVPAAVAQRDAKPAGSSSKSTVVAMDEERIRLAEIQQLSVGPAMIARRLAVPGTRRPECRPGGPYRR
jgi:cobalt-zinc-cadmium efflux system membrane fusion protein